jgi:mRNA interferase RelE/StbE
MEITYKRNFLKQLLALPKKVQNDVREILILLENAKNLQGSGVDYKFMEGQKKGEKYYRIRCGDYRIGIENTHPNIYVITIVKRNDIYKKFP